MLLDLQENIMGQDEDRCFRKWNVDVLGNNFELQIL